MSVERSGCSASREQVAPSPEGDVAITIGLSSAEAFSRFHDIAEALLEFTGQDNSASREYLENKGRAFGLHPLDIERALAEVRLSPHVKAAIARAEAQSREMELTWAVVQDRRLSAVETTLAALSSLVRSLEDDQKHSVASDEALQQRLARLEAKAESIALPVKLTPIRIPNLGEGIEEGTVGRWRVSAGDHVRIGQTLLEIETDKVNLEIPAPEPGIIREIVGQEGGDYPVGATIAWLEPTTE